MKKFKGQIVKQCLLFDHPESNRSHLLVELEDGSWWVDTRKVSCGKPPTKTVIRRQCLTKFEALGFDPANITIYDL